MILMTEFYVAHLILRRSQPGDGDILGIYWTTFELKE